MHDSTACRDDGSVREQWDRWFRVGAILVLALAAVVVGGVALTGGFGSMLNVFYGVVILGMLSNSMTMIGVSSFFLSSP